MKTKLTVNIQYFFQSDAVATIFFAARFVRLLFEGGYSSRAPWETCRHQQLLEKVHVHTSETATVARCCQ